MFISRLPTAHQAAIAKKSCSHHAARASLPPIPFEDTLGGRLARPPSHSEAKRRSNLRRSDEPPAPDSLAMPSDATAKGYAPVKASENDGGDWDGDLTRREAALAQREKRFKFVLLGNVAVFFVSLCFLVISWFSKPSMLECDKMTSPYSPVFNGGIEHWEGDFQNVFNQTSKYRGPPTLELESAWEELWYQPGVGLSIDEIAKLNKTRPGVSFTEIEGSDPKNPTYAATLEVFHQIHCLSLIRQATWPLRMFNESWHAYPWFLTDELAGRMHVDHCLESLRLSLMCYADVTPVLAENNPMRPTGLQLDFNVHHKCRNYDKMLEYVQAHGVDVPPE